MPKAQVKQKKKRQSSKLSYKFWSNSTPLPKFYK
jgi:hypothetical protein